MDYAKGWKPVLFSTGSAVVLFLTVVFLALPMISESTYVIVGVTNPESLRRETSTVSHIHNEKAPWPEHLVHRSKNNNPTSGHQRKQRRSHPHRYAKYDGQWLDLDERMQAMEPITNSAPQRSLVSVNEGDPITLKCPILSTSSDSDQERYRWFKDTKPIRSTSRTHIDQESGNLIIRQTTSEDHGQYLCEVIDSEPPMVSPKEIKLSIKEKLKFVAPPVSRKLELNSTAKIHCKARGAVTPTMKWIKEGHDILSSHVKDNAGTLQFNGVRWEDKGRYTCIATNSEQGTISETIDVDVVVKPYFIRIPENMTMPAGRAAMLNCEADGDPKPSVQWDRDGNLNDFDNTRFNVLPNGTLAVSQVLPEDAGKYGCTIGNSGGFKRAEFTLSINGTHPDAFSMTGDGAANRQFNPFSVGTDSNLTKTLSMTLGAATLYMLLVLATMIWCRYRRAKRKAMSSRDQSAPNNEQPNGQIGARGLNGDVEMKERIRHTPSVISNPMGPEQHPSLQRMLVNGTPSEVESYRRVPRSDVSAGSSHHSKESSASRAPLERMQIPRTRLHTIMMLGHGEYGEVFLAKATGLLHNGHSDNVVMVKSLTTKEDSVVADFKQELDMLHKSRHERIAKLLAICREQEPFLMVLEYSDWGDLKQFLIATRSDNHHRPGPKPSPLNITQMLIVAHQVAQGMNYLTESRFIHRDLAARNCLISSKFKVKITCASVSKDQYANEYHLIGNRLLPIRWAPSEAIFEDEWSAKSDVYSFAVLCWEIFTQACFPFSELSDEEVLKAMSEGHYHMLQLDYENIHGLPLQFGACLRSCQSVQAAQRPHFNLICNCLEMLLVQHHPSSTASSLQELARL